MVAGIFAAHGIWVGRTAIGDMNNKKGYFENRDVKRAVFQHFGKDFLTKPDYDPKFTPKLREILPKGQFLVKIGALYYDLFRDFDPIYIKLWRPIDKIMDSYKRCGFLRHYSNKDIEKIITQQHDIMKTLPGPDIHTPDLIRGKRQELKDAFDAVGVKYDPKIANEFIDPAFYDT